MSTCLSRLELVLTFSLPAVPPTVPPTVPPPCFTQGGTWETPRCLPLLCTGPPVSIGAATPLAMATTGRNLPTGSPLPYCPLQSILHWEPGSTDHVIPLLKTLKRFPLASGQSPYPFPAHRTAEPQPSPATSHTARGFPILSLQLKAPHSILCPVILLIPAHPLGPS